jgi:mutator protein MutT
MTNLDESDGPIRVGIGLVMRNGRYLIRPRPEGTIMAGYWEFPGGKCEPGEAPEAATGRECREELGFEVAVGGLRRRITFRYPHAWVELFYFDCRAKDRDADPQPGTGFRWVAAEDLPGLTFPEANGPILEELALEAARTRR